ncbi:hypothetical protein [Geobacter sp.]|jgi:hypothetical protein|nr:hypothetical protein [Geobacter sp.]
MDLNNQLVDPVVEVTGVRAVVAYAVGGVVGAAIALPVLIGVFGL